MNFKEISSTNIVLGVLILMIGTYVFYRSYNTTLDRYLPSTTSSNCLPEPNVDFPVSLEEETVKRMVPNESTPIILPSSYKPVLDDSLNATPLH